MNGYKAALYIHIPFCVRKCDYCDFYSSCDLSIQGELIEKIPLQMKDLCAKYGVKSFSTLYLGGGTPGLIESGVLSKLLGSIKKYNGHLFPEEVTMECNPGNISREKLSEWEKMGINRISLGVQSFRDEFLKKAGRMSSRKCIIEALELISSFSSFNLNIDIIQGLPGMAEEDQKRDLLEALSWNPDHISWYSLILEKGSVLKNAWEERNGKIAPDNDKIWEEGCSLLNNSGYNRYEISNFSRMGKESCHNQYYWKLKPYLGVGPSAVSMLRNSSGGIQRFRTVPESKNYARGNFHYDDCETLGARDFLKDFLLMGLRLKEGINLTVFKSIFGLNPEQLISLSIEKWTSAGCLILDDRKLAPTERGMNMLNSILIDLFLEIDEKEIEISPVWPSE